MSRVIGEQGVFGSPVTAANVRRAVQHDPAGVKSDLGLGSAAGFDSSVFAPAVHTHDDRYYTESEVDTALAGKSATSHTHDDRYYTEAEVDTALALKSDTTHTHTGAAVVTSLGGAQAAIANDASGAANQATVNAILAALRSLGLLTP
jgi:hypothetical protein